LIRRWLFLIGIAVGIALGIRTFLFEAVSVASSSMEPTLYLHTHYMVNRIVYKFRPPQRGDIVVFSSPVDRQTGFIKRVIGVAGDTIELRDKRVILNGQPLEEPYAIYKRASEQLVGDNLGPLTVPEGSVFVLGDNRDESFDSTAWTDANGKPIYFLPIQLIKGRLMRAA
jgi:signal peptidase I